MNTIVDLEMKTAKLSKRVVIFVLVVLILLNIAIRFPTTPHEIGADSFTMHIYANTIKELDHAPWTFNGLSYFGLYPLSYPTGGPMLLAIVSDLTGMSMEVTIFLISTFLGVISVLMAFMLAGIFLKDGRFKLLVAFGYSTSPLILKFTIWTFSTRGIFLVILPIFLWLFLQYRDRSNYPRHYYDILAMIFLIILASVHRMFWVAVFLMVIYVGIIFVTSSGNFVKFVYKRMQKFISITLVVLCGILILMSVLFSALILFPGFGTSGIAISLISLNPGIFFFIVSLIIPVALLTYIGRRKKSLRAIGGFALLLSFVSIFLIQFTPLDPYRSSWWIRQIAPGFVNIDTMSGQMIALGVILGARIGLFIIAGTLGLLYILFKTRLNINILYLVLATLVFLPFIHYVMYVHEALSILFFIFGAIMVIAILEWKPKIKLKKVNWIIIKTIPIGLTVFLVGALIFSLYTTTYRYSDEDKETGYGNYMTVETYDAALFARTYNIEIDEGFYSARVKAISGELYNVSINDIYWIEHKGLPDITDLWGWYSFLKNPSGNAEILERYKPIKVLTISSSELSNNKKTDYILFASSDIIVVRVLNG